MYYTVSVAVLVEKGVDEEAFRVIFYVSKTEHKGFKILTSFDVSLLIAKGTVHGYMLRNT